MKLTYNWLKDFVDIRLKPEDLADRLTMAGLEVKAIDKFEDDYVFEIEITSNRPDWLSVIGVAREIAAVTKSKVKSQKSKFKIQNHKRETIPFKIAIEDKKACPLYSARVISDVKIGPSPEWMAKRLRSIGLRPVNNIVDITNYVLFTTGQPLHAFDSDKIVGAKISARFAQKNEEIITIDGIKRKLTPEILVIADENHPIAIAGIMGGKDTQVNEFTKNILLESAYFAPTVVRPAVRRLALASDSSYRFERSVDITQVVNSSDLAAGLFQKYAAGKICGLCLAGLKPKKTAGQGAAVGLPIRQRAMVRLPIAAAIAQDAKTILFSLFQANKLLGREIPLARAKSIFKTLEFKVGTSKGDVLKLTPPGFRQDIKSDVDLVEELCRIYGYENIPLSLPAVRHQAIEEDSLILIRKKAREILSALGYSEAISYSLLSREIIAKAAGEDSADIVCLENPLSAQQEVLRPLLSIGLLGVLARNLELGNRNPGFFELGDCFLKEKESRVLGLIEEGGLIELKGKVELLLAKLGVEDYSFANMAYPVFSPGQGASLVVSGCEAGIIGQVNPDVLKNFKIDSSGVSYCELNLDALKPYVRFEKAYTELPKYPAVSRDLTLIAKEQVSYQGILDEIMTARIKELEAVRFKDIYCSEALGKDRKSITISLEFRSPEATLTDFQVNGYMEKIVQTLTLNPGISLR